MDDGYPQQAAPKGGTSPWAGTPLEDLPPSLPPDPELDPEPDPELHGPATDTAAGGPGSEPEPGSEPSGRDPRHLADGAAEGRPPAAEPPQNWPTEHLPVEDHPTAGYPAESHPAEGVPAGYPAEGYPTEEYPSDADEEDLGLIEASMGPPPRVRLLTAGLVLGILAALGFAAGAVVQRHHESILVGAQGGAGANRAGRGAGAAGGGGFGGGGFGGGGFGGGGFGGGGQGNGAPTGAGGGAGADAGGAGGAAGGAAGGDTAAATPIVVGTVTSVTPTTLMVKNFAGTVVIVHVPAGTPVTSRGLAGLKPGVTVAVTGTRAADGSVTATSVVSRG